MNNDKNLVNDINVRPLIYKARIKKRLINFTCSSVEESSLGRESMRTSISFAHLATRVANKCA
jgi:hypothetical protein